MQIKLHLILFILILSPLLNNCGPKADIDQMIAEIKKDFASSSNSTGIKELSSEVENALRGIPREEFVPANLKASAYENRPLSIGHGQTISQPFIVAIMTQLLNVDANSIVLEVGTGSGYQAAVLSKIVKDVYSIERIPKLAKTAESRFTMLGLNNITTITGDGTKGLPKFAPFDGIIVTAGGEVTQDLKDQLKNGANLVIPVSQKDGSQILTVFSKDKNGVISERKVLNVKFVPLIPS